MDRDWQEMSDSEQREFARVLVLASLFTIPVIIGIITVGTTWIWTGIR